LTLLSRLAWLAWLGTRRGSRGIRWDAINLSRREALHRNQLLAWWAARNLPKL
jgi:hypothetical protein